MWGTVLKRDLLGETREEEKFHSRKQLDEYINSEIEKQGKNVVIRNLDVSLIEDLSELFKGCTNIRTLDLSGWKTSGVKNMSYMFFNCYSLKSLDLSGWKASNVEDMRWMFFACYSLKSLDLSGWDTSNVISMRSLFYDCNSLKDLDLSGWDTSNIKHMGNIVRDMGDMFWGCPAPYKVIDNKIVKLCGEQY